MWYLYSADSFSCLKNTTYWVNTGIGNYYYITHIKNESNAIYEGDFNSCRSELEKYKQQEHCEWMISI
jgi:hypothetical protein